MADAITLSFSTTQEVNKMLDELIWQASLANEQPVTRSQVLTQLIKDAWAQAATKTKQS